MRRTLQGFTSLDRLKACGRVPVNPVGGTVLRVSETSQGRRAGIAGLMACGSPWACPVCARRIAAKRATDVGRVLHAVNDSKGSAGLLTLTIRHSKRDTLRDMWAALSAAWGSVTSGRGWVTDQGAFGVRGWIRTVEYSHSPETGHHLHVHAVIVFDSVISRDLMDEMAARAFVRWERSLVRKGFSAVADKGGLDMRPIVLTADSIEAVAEYVSKAAFEVTSQHTKKGRGTSRSAFEILADACQGEADSIELWWLWEQTSLGRKQVTYSRGLRDWARLEREESDEEAANEDMGGEDQLALPAETWEAIRDEVPDLLDAVELGGVEAAERWLKSRGLAYTRVVPRPADTIAEPGLSGPLE
ncbi:protein rep [Pseudonocardia ailaonensis]